MRVTVQHGLKIPAELEYSSRQHSVALEVDVPEDVVAKGKEAIRDFIARVTAEVRGYVEEALGSTSDASGESAAASSERRATSSDTTPRTPPPGRNGGPRIHRPVRRDASRNGAKGNAGNGEGASYKQLQFARSLSARLGMSAGQLSALCEESFGRTLDEISKKDASALIEQLRSEAA